MVPRILPSYGIPIFCSTAAEARLIEHDQRQQACELRCRSSVLEPHDERACKERGAMWVQQRHAVKNDTAARALTHATDGAMSAAHELVLHVVRVTNIGRDSLGAKPRVQVMFRAVVIAASLAGV